MTDRSDSISIPDQDRITALCEELTQLAQVIAESRENNVSVAEELYHRLPTLRSMLVDFERELTSREPEGG